MICTKDFTLEVQSSGVDWDTLSWSITNNFASGSATSTSTFNGSEVAMRTQTAETGFPGVAVRVVEGSLVYAGGAVNCNLNLFSTFASMTPPPGAGASFQAGINVFYDDGMGEVQVLGVTSDVEWNDYLVLSSSTDFPFAIAGAGAIRVTVAWQSAATDPGDSVDIGADVTFSNVP